MRSGMLISIDLFCHIYRSLLTLAHIPGMQRRAYACLDGYVRGGLLFARLNSRPEPRNPKHICTCAGSGLVAGLREGTNVRVRTCSRARMCWSVCACVRARVGTSGHRVSCLFLLGLLLLFCPPRVHDFLRLLGQELAEDGGHRREGDEKLQALPVLFPCGLHVLACPRGACIAQA